MADDIVDAPKESAENTIAATKSALVAKAPVMSQPLTHIQSPALDAEAAPAMPGIGAFDTERKLQLRRDERLQFHQHLRRKRLKWLVPVASTALFALMVLGIWMSQKPPAPPSQPSVSLLDVKKDNGLFGPGKKSPPTDSGALLMNPDRAVRPAVLIGRWQDTESDRMIELRSNGTAVIKGAWINDTVMDHSSPWFVRKVEGREYWLDFGPELLRNENIIATFRMQDDGTVRLIRFGSRSIVNGMNFTSRILKKLD